MQIGFALALIAALMGSLASLLKHRGCQGAPLVRFRKPLSSARGLAMSPWFAAGWGLAALAWLVHVAALSMAPISLVQAILAAGAVALAVIAKGLFGHSVARRQWLALLLGSGGLAVLALTVPHFHGTHSAFTPAAMLGFEGGFGLIAAALAIGHRFERLGGRRALVFATLSGILFALAGVATKGLTGASALPVTAIATLVIVIGVCGALAQYTAVLALQRGGAIETIGLMGLLANAIQIAAGIVVFGDPLSASPLGITLQVGAFTMVCLSALFLPGRAAASLERPGRPGPVAGYA